MDDDDIHKADQSSAFLGDVLPPLWWRLFTGCVEAGFSREQAMELVRTYIHGNAGGRMER